MQAEAALGPGLAGEVRRVLAWNRRGLVVELRTYGAMWGADGATDGGGPFENVFLSVFMTSVDDVRSSTLFDLTDADSALAWFAGQTSTESPTT